MVVGFGFVVLCLQGCIPLLKSKIQRFQNLMLSGVIGVRGVLNFKDEEVTSLC